MKLQLLGNYHSPVLSGRGGEIFDNVDDRVGQGLLEAGYATRLDLDNETTEATPADGEIEVSRSDTPEPVGRRSLKLASKK